MAPGEHALAWDSTAGKIERDKLGGLDAIVNLAGAGIGDRRWSPARKQLVTDSRTQSTALIAGAIAAVDNPPRVLVNVSAIGFYGDRGDETITEQTGPGSDFLAVVCQLWEAASGAGERGRGTRGPGQVGPGPDPHRGALAKLLPLFRLGLGGPYSGSGSQWWSWISLEDEVGALVWLLENEVAGPVNLTAPEPVTNRDFTATLARVLSRPAGIPVPPFGPRVLLGRQLADSLLFTSARTSPTVLEAGGYAFMDVRLEECLRRMLGQQS